MYCFKTRDRACISRLYRSAFEREECRANVLTPSVLTKTPNQSVHDTGRDSNPSVRYSVDKACLPVLPFACGCSQLRVQESPTAVATVVSQPRAPPGRPRSAGRVREGGGCEEDGGTALPAGEHLLLPPRQQRLAVCHCTSLG